MRNIAMPGADRLGSKMTDSLRLGFTTLVMVDAGTTFVVLALLPPIPAVLMKSRDSGIAAEPQVI